MRILWCMVNCVFFLCVILYSWKNWYEWFFFFKLKALTLKLLKLLEIKNNNGPKIDPWVNPVINNFQFYYNTSHNIDHCDKCLILYILITSSIKEQQKRVDQYLLRWWRADFVVYYQKYWLL